MDIKAIYEALSGIEGGSEMVEYIKTEVVKKRDDAESQNRTLQAQVDQFKDVDIAELKSKAEFVDNSGGVEKLHEAIAKAEGFEGNEAKMQEMKSKYSALEEKHKADSENSKKEVDLLNMRLDLMPQLAGVFRGNAIEDVLDSAIGKGFVFRGDTGICIKDGDEVLSFKDGGFEKFKERYSYALDKPSGGGLSGGSSGSGGGGENKPTTLLEKLEANHKA